MLRIIGSFGSIVKLSEENPWPLLKWWSKADNSNHKPKKYVQRKKIQFIFHFILSRIFLKFVSSIDEIRIFIKYYLRAGVIRINSQVNQHV